MCSGACRAGPRFCFAAVLLSCATTSISYHSFSLLSTTFFIFFKVFLMQFFAVFRNPLMRLNPLKRFFRSPHLFWQSQAVQPLFFSSETNTITPKRPVQALFLFFIFPHTMCILLDLSDKSSPVMWGLPSSVTPWIFTCRQVFKSQGH